MPSLLLLRHGKSEWGVPGVADHERPLKKRGVRAARVVGRCLTTGGLVPDRVWSSTALRARTTAELAREAGGWGAPVEERRELYETSPEALVELLRAVEPEVGTLLVVGHEPTLSSLASLATGGSELAFPTACTAWLELAAWSDLAPGRAVLRALLAPRLIGAKP